jgi:hypothetical protein
MESLLKMTIFGLKMVVKNGLEKLLFQPLHADKLLSPTSFSDFQKYVKLIVTT